MSWQSATNYNPMQINEWEVELILSGWLEPRQNSASPEGEPEGSDLDLEETTSTCQSSRRSRSQEQKEEQERSAVDIPQGIEQEVPGEWEGFPGATQGFPQRFSTISLRISLRKVSCSHIYLFGGNTILDWMVIQRIISFYVTLYWDRSTAVQTWCTSLMPSYFYCPASLFSGTSEAEKIFIFYFLHKTFFTAVSLATYSGGCTLCNLNQIESYHNSSKHSPFECKLMEH